MDPEPEDFLHDYTGLARWSWHAGAIQDADLQTLNDLARHDPQGAADAFQQALRLRAAIDRIFRATADGRDPAAGDLQTLQQEHLEGLSSAALAREGQRIGWSWRGVDDLRLPVWLEGASAVALLTEGDLARVKQCPGADDCGWLFYDTSRSGTRRWCSMEGCGSRVKMRRHYARRTRRAP
jgi:predicted RNA-binding Zn ribbon-like protein